MGVDKRLSSIHTLFIVYHAFCLFNTNVIIMFVCMLIDGFGGLREFLCLRDELNAGGGYLSAVTATMCVD